MHFYLKVVSKFELDLENLKKSKIKPTINPSDNLQKIVKLLHHKVKNATQYFNDLLDTFQKDFQDENEFEQNESNLFFELIDHLGIRINKILTKIDSLGKRIEGIKQRIFSGARSKNLLSSGKDQIFQDSLNLNRQRGLKDLESVISNMERKNVF